MCVCVCVLDRNSPNDIPFTPTLLALCRIHHSRRQCTSILSTPPPMYIHTLHPAATPWGLPLYSNALSHVLYIFQARASRVAYSPRPRVQKAPLLPTSGKSTALLIQRTLYIRGVVRVLDVGARGLGVEEGEVAVPSCHPTTVSQIVPRSKAVIGL